jgi:hypothetical protein
MNLHSEMAAAAAESARAVGGVRADQFSAATPCTDWDLHALLNHIILWTAYSAELDKAVAAWSDPAAWERNPNVMGSATPAADVAVLSAVEANAELFRKYQGFAMPVQVPACAPALDRALAQSGRDPAWVPIG